MSWLSHDIMRSFVYAGGEHNAVLLCIFLGLMLINISATVHDQTDVFSGLTRPGNDMWWLSKKVVGGSRHVTPKMNNL